MITLWWYRIIPHRSEVKGWKISPSHYLKVRTFQASGSTADHVTGSAPSGLSAGRGGPHRSFKLIGRPCTNTRQAQSC